MTENPVSLDKMIAYVKTLTPGAGPLENLSDAVAVGSGLSEVADSLIGHFVDQARRSGASWSEIGASMGVTKQAAQKRFVLRWDDDNPLAAGRRFSRFTDRARHCVVHALNAARAAGAESIEVEHLAVGLMGESGGLAAVIVHQAGVTDAQIYAAFLPAGTVYEPTHGGISAAELNRPPFSEAAKSALQETLHAALNLGHNYIGTEHILLGIIRLGGPVADKLAEFGVTSEFTERELAVQFEKIKAKLKE